MTAEQIKKIWEEYPKSKEALLNWFKSQFESNSGYPEIDTYLQQATKNIEGVTILSLSAKPPRFLYEFFDRYEIYMVVGRHDDVWGYSFSFTKNGLDATGGENRIDAETTGFLKAFEILESKLNG